jgi:hypothetical protein
MSTDAIPDTLHLCPDCGDLASGLEFCDQCHIRKWHIAQHQRRHRRQRFARIERTVAAYGLLMLAYFSWRWIVWCMVAICTAFGGAS